MTNVSAPIDATQTSEWQALKTHYKKLRSEGISLKQWFAEDHDRVKSFLSIYQTFILTCQRI